MSRRYEEDQARRLGGRSDSPCDPAHQRTMAWVLWLVTCDEFAPLRLRCHYPRSEPERQGGALSIEGHCPVETALDRPKARQRL
eukprot:318208-Pleurochrysis_carterae.AAC.1